MTDKELKEIEVYKKWTKTKTFSGFATFYNWCEGERVKIEIADTSGDNGVKSLSTVYIPTWQFITYLHAEVYGFLPRLYPSMLEPNEHHGITIYGGTNIARVFKIEDWNYRNKNLDKPSGNRRFKAGEFEIKPGSQASEPDWSKPINVNQIQMKPFEIAELYHHLVTVQQAFETEWMVSGKTHAWMESHKSRRDFLRDLRGDK